MNLSVYEEFWLASRVAVSAFKSLAWAGFCSAQMIASESRDLYGSVCKINSDSGIRPICSLESLVLISIMLHDSKIVRVQETVNLERLTVSVYLEFFLQAQGFLGQFHNLIHRVSHRHIRFRHRLEFAFGCTNIAHDQRSRVTHAFAFWRGASRNKCNHGFFHVFG